MKFLGVGHLGYVMMILFNVSETVPLEPEEGAIRELLLPPFSNAYKIWNFPLNYGVLSIKKVSNYLQNAQIQQLTCSSVTHINHLSRLVSDTTHARNMS